MKPYLHGYCLLQRAFEVKLKMSLFPYQKDFFSFLLLFFLFPLLRCCHDDGFLLEKIFQSSHKALGNEKGFSSEAPGILVSTVCHCRSPQPRQQKFQMKIDIFIPLGSGHGLFSLAADAMISWAFNFFKKIKTKLIFGLYITCRGFFFKKKTKQTREKQEMSSAAEDETQVNL